MRHPDEPHTLIGGTLVHDGAISLLDVLRADGRTVTIDGSGEIVVSDVETLAYETRIILEAFDEDLRILLTIGAHTIH